MEHRPYPLVLDVMVDLEAAFPRALQALSGEELDSLQRHLLARLALLQSGHDGP